MIWLHSEGNFSFFFVRAQDNNSWKDLQACHHHGQQVWVLSVCLEESCSTQGEILCLAAAPGTHPVQNEPETEKCSRLGYLRPLRSGTWNPGPHHLPVWVHTTFLAPSRLGPRQHPAGVQTVGSAGTSRSSSSLSLSTMFLLCCWHLWLHRHGVVFRHQAMNLRYLLLECHNATQLWRWRLPVQLRDEVEHWSNLFLM